MRDTALPMIPSEWQLAIQRLEDWRHEAPLTSAQWESLVNWLLLSSFGDKSYMAGEVGAQLIRDSATDNVLDRFMTATSLSLWVIHFKNIASVGRQHPLRSSLLTRASRESNLEVKTFAQSVLKSVEDDLADFVTCEDPNRGWPVPQKTRLALPP